MRHARILRLLLAALVVAGCAPGLATVGSTTVTFPAATWPRADAASAGFDPNVLSAIAADAEARDSNCLVVVRHGAIVAEWYWNGTDPTSTQNVFSVTKSLTSTLVGVAQAAGDLHIDDLASKYIPQWVGTTSGGVTVRDLLSNDSGRHWDAATDYRQMHAARDRTGFAVSLGQDSPPGATWVYNNAAIQTLDAVLKVATDMPVATYAEKKVLAPVGMRHSQMSPDPSGNTIVSSGLRSTCEDLARFGYLFLHDGQWNGTQIVPAEWVHAATAQPSQALNAAYGLLWWLNRTGAINANPLHPSSAAEAAALTPSRLLPTAPEAMYWALGFGGQVVQVDPGSDTVVVRLGAADELSAISGPGNAGGYGPADTAKVVTQALIDAST